MGYLQVLEKHLTKFGENNSPAIIAIGIAAAKGIFRPIFTMMDKKEDFETKRYAALREGLTEAIAIPVYYSCGAISKALAKKMAKPEHFTKNDLWERAKAGDKSPDVLKAVKQGENLAKENLPKIQTSINFVCVCASALIIIPLICSITIKPILKKIEKNKKEVNKQGNYTPLPKENTVIKQQTFKQRPRISNRYNNILYNAPVCTSMKVGGV